MKYLSMVVILAACFAVFTLQADAADAVIKSGSKVAFDYMLTVDGKIVDSSQVRGPLEYTHGEGHLIPGLTKELEGMKVGDEKTVEVKPEDAYGNPDPAGIKEMPLSSVPGNVKPEVGMMLQMQDQDGQIFPAKVTEIKKDSIIIDLNHPLAGKTLTFKVRIVSIK
jgi:FKBP-type peptidyl-prolyl cis-trans isomerase 2